MRRSFTSLEQVLCWSKNGSYRRPIRAECISKKILREVRSDGLVCIGRVVCPIGAGKLLFSFLPCPSVSVVLAAADAVLLSA